MTAVLAVEDLRVATTAGEEVVKGVSFSVAPGEVVALIGESGAGKSTIGLAALGYRRPGLRIVGGSVRLNGTDLLTLSPEALRSCRGRDVAYVAQSAAAAFDPVHRILWQLTEAPVRFGLKTRAEATADMVALARRMRLPDPDEIVRRYPHEVSGGQLQRMMAMMAMGCGPSLLVLDEPTTALDVSTQVEVLRAIMDVIRAGGTSAIYVSHDLAVVAQVADRIVVLRHGAVVETGETGRLLSAPREAYTRELIDAVHVVPKVPATIRPAPEPVAHPAPEPPPLLRLRNVSASYGALPVLHGIDLELGRGRVLGVIGESGSGKSTLAKVIAGLLPPTEGEVLLDGRLLQPRVEDRRQEDRRAVQLVVQMPDLAFNPARTIGQSLDRHLAYFTDLPRAERTEQIARLLDTVEMLPELADRRPQDLSGGQKQRANLARGLLVNPALLLCDEVTSALDTVVAATVVRLLRRLKRDLGQAMIFVSHDIATVARVADEVAVLERGRLVEHRRTEDLLEAPSHPYTRTLLRSVPELRPGWLAAFDASEADTQEKAKPDRRMST